MSRVSKECVKQELELFNTCQGLQKGKVPCGNKRLGGSDDSGINIEILTTATKNACAGTVYEMQPRIIKSKGKGIGRRFARSKSLDSLTWLLKCSDENITGRKLEILQ